MLFSVKFVPCGSTCCSGRVLGLGIQARAARSPADVVLWGALWSGSAETQPWPLLAITLQLEVPSFRRDTKQRSRQIATFKNTTFPATVGVLPPELQPAFNSSNFTRSLPGILLVLSARRGNLGCPSCCHVPGCCTAAGSHLEVAAQQLLTK